jgi:hypothetical protein
MMSATWMILVAVLGLIAISVIVPIAADNFFRYRTRRVVHCPVENTNARVLVNAPIAALTSVLGMPTLRIERCSLWPDRADCAQRCTRYLT